MHLQHPFKDKIDVDEFSHDSHGLITTIDRFCNHVASLSEKHRMQIRINDFKGHSLELLTEYLIQDAGSDNRIGIYDYCPVVYGDTGVDGFGLGEDGRPATVQVKFRLFDYMLSGNEDHLMNFPLASFMKYGVPLDSDKNMLIITSGKDVHPFTLQEMLGGKVRVLNRDNLKSLLDNRTEWWTRFFEQIAKDQILTDSGRHKKPVLRKHQNAAVDSWKTFTDDRGKIICPTGSGKTYIQSEIAFEVIRSKKAPVIQFNSPRILLCWQLLEESIKYLVGCGIEDAIFVNFNSGSYDEQEYVQAIRSKGGIYRQIESTTHLDVIREKYRQSQELQIPLIIVSTYHSAEKLAASGVVPDVVFNDEAHNLVSEEFSKIASLPAGQHLFFTATEKDTRSSDSFGMNNIDIYGTTIFEISPREIIEAGEMLPPWIHVIQPDERQEYSRDKLENDYEAMFKSVANAFLAHNCKIKEDALEPDAISAKMLCTLRGQEEMIKLFDTQVYLRFRKEHPEVHFFALSTDFGVRCDDEFWAGQVSSTKKQMMMDRLKALESNEQAIIFHVDMIGEGIDVPGITGTMLFRNLCDVKLYQTIGRACRLHPMDRESLYSGEISVENKRVWIKPQSWIIMPDLFAGSQDSIDRTKEIVAKLRNEYGFQPRTNVFIDVKRGLFEPDEMDVVNPREDESRNSDSGLEEFKNNFEDVVDILHHDSVSRMKRKRKVCDNLIGRMLRDVEVPSQLEEIFSGHFLANLLFVYLVERKEDFDWDSVSLETQKLFEENIFVDLKWEQVVLMLKESFPQYSAAQKELMNYLQLNYEAVSDAVATGEKEIIDMAKACLSSDVAKKKFGEVFTPTSLCDEMLDKLPAEVWTNPDLRWIDPAMGSGNFLIRVVARLMEGLADAIPDETERRKHILEEMVFGVELQPKNVMIALMFLDPDGEFATHLTCADSLNFGYWGGMKFDVVVGNPPYQDAEKAKGKLGSKALWVRFVNLVLDNLLSPKGYLVFVHPSKWRKYEDELWNKMTSRQILHLDIHGYKDGQRVFGAATRYDWYVLRNVSYVNSTTVHDEEGKDHLIDIRQWSFLPNFAFKEIKALLGNGSRVETIHSYSVYEIRKSHMNKEATTTHNLPCIYSINRANTPSIYYSSEDKGYFGIPKVIFASGATGFIVDFDGQYGLTQFATGVVDKPENLDNIARALNSNKFQRIILATSMSKAEIDRKILGLFRKDFWNDFI